MKYKNASNEGCAYKWFVLIGTFTYKAHALQISCCGNEGIEMITTYRGATDLLPVPGTVGQIELYEGSLSFSGRSVECIPICIVGWQTPEEIPYLIKELE